MLTHTWRVEPGPARVTRCVVTGLDAASGTPDVDLEPLIVEFLPAGVGQPEWVSRLMADDFRPWAVPALVGPPRPTGAEDGGQPRLRRARKTSSCPGRSGASRTSTTA